MRYTVQDVKNSLQHYPSFQSDGGRLIPFEFNSLPFPPKRIFYVTDIIPGEIRGCHARKTTHQLLVCVNGKINNTVKDLYGKSYTTELTAGDSVLIPPYIWDFQIYYDRNSSLLCFCNKKYKPNDYITNWQEFLKNV